MSEQENKNPRESKKSFLDNYLEINRQEREAEVEVEAKAAEHRRAEREEYEKQLARERIELMKLKSGVEAELGSLKEEAPERVYTIKEKIADFFYHYKAHLIVFALMAGLAGFLIYDVASRVQPDVSVIFMATDGNFALYAEKAAEVFERYCEDFNGDKKVVVRVSYLPVKGDNDSQADFYYNQAEQLKLMAAFQTTDTIIIIADREAVKEAVIEEGVLKDLREVYPHNEDVNEYGYMLNATSFAEDIGYPDLADNLFASFREPHGGAGVNEKDFIMHYNNAIAMWDNYINGNIVNEEWGARNEE
ncbi:MAG: hypothetical protein FWG90_07430 [Oscillospiraceae bacterium]|nr:hypothetical protein [Oscillospiraceae bacterium]